MKTVTVLTLQSKTLTKAKKLGVNKKLTKAIELLEQNPRHPSLNVELLEPKSMKIYSFRIDRKIRAIFIWHNNMKAIEVINLTVHYH